MAKKKKPVEAPAKVQDSPAPVVTEEKVTPEKAAELESKLKPQENPAPVVTEAEPTAFLGVYSVEIPNCLLGLKYVQADDEHAALDKYKAVCGISGHDQPAKVLRTDFDPEQLPEGVELFGDE